MKAKQAIETFIYGMKQERKARTTLSSYLSHVRSFLAGAAIDIRRHA